LTAEAAAVRAIATAEYTHMIKLGARMNAMPTATNLPTVKMIKA